MEQWARQKWYDDFPQQKTTTEMGAVRITSLNPKFNGSHFGLPPSAIHRMTGWVAFSRILWRMRTAPIEKGHTRRWEGYPLIPEHKATAGVVYCNQYDILHWEILPETVHTPEESWQRMVLKRQSHLKYPTIGAAISDTTASTEMAIKGLIFVLRKKGSKTKKRTKEEEIEKGDCGPPTPKDFFEISNKSNKISKKGLEKHRKCHNMHTPPVKNLLSLSE